MYMEVKANCIVISEKRMVKEGEYITQHICSG